MPGECPPAAPSASQAPPWSPVSEMPVSGNVAPDNPDLARFGLSPAARKHELPVRQVDGGEKFRCYALQKNQAHILSWYIRASKNHVVEQLFVNRPRVRSQTVSSLYLYGAHLAHPVRGQK